MAFCLSKPNAQDNLDSLWAVWNDTAKYELSDSFYQYLTETSFDTLVLELEHKDSSHFVQILNNPLQCLRIGEYLFSNGAKEKYCYFYQKGADLLYHKNFNENPKLQRIQYDLITNFCDCIPPFSKDSLKLRLITLAKNLKDTYKISLGFIDLARIKKAKNDLDYSKKYLDSSFYYLNFLGPTVEKQILLYHYTLFKGELLLTRGDSENAYILFQKALNIGEKISSENPDLGDFTFYEFNSARLLSQLMLRYAENKKAITLIETFLEKYDTTHLGYPEMATLYNDLGDIYSNTGTKNFMLSDSIKIAIDYYKRSLYFRKKDNYRFIGWTYRGLGNTFLLTLNDIKGLTYLDSAEQFFSDAGEFEGLMGVYKNKSEYYQKINNVDSAMLYAKKYLILNNDFDLSISKVQFSYFLKNKNYKKAVDISNSIIIYADRLESELKNFSRLKTIDDKRNLENSMIQDSINFKNQISLEQANVKSEKQRRNSLLIVSIVVFTSLILVFSQLKKVQRSKKLIEGQKKIVEEKQQEITDSVNYAKRLQDGILVPFDLVQSWITESFILYKPKDIVSGDFYWIEKVGNKVYFAVADCTGHGIPGALVSIICSNALTKSLYEDFTYEPSRILDNTRAIVEERFIRSQNEIKDGMDISLCCLNLEEKSITWAGAMNPLWIIRKGAKDIEELKPDRQTVAKVENPKRFKQHEVKLAEGDSVYLFSDGYQDQFGGEKGKKYMKGRFKKFILSIQDQDMQTQLASFEKEFNSWKGDREQIDDVCVMGVRIS